VLFLLGLLISLLRFIEFYPVKLILDSVLDNKAFPYSLRFIFSPDKHQLLINICLGLCMVFFVRYFLHWFYIMLQAYVGESLTLLFRKKLFAHAQSLDMAFHQNSGSYSLTYKIQEDAKVIQWIAVEACVPICIAILNIILVLSYIYYINPGLGAVASFNIPILFVMNYLYQKKIRKQWHEAKSIESSSLAVVQEALSSLKIVQAFSREELEKYRFESRGQVSVSRMLKLMRDRGLMDFFVGMSLALGMILAVYFFKPFTFGFKVF
jgi:ABC-type multidrug transport system fused ATPase/permease subunit